MDLSTAHMVSVPNLGPQIDLASQSYTACTPLMTQRAGRHNGLRGPNPWTHL